MAWEVESRRKLRAPRTRSARQRSHTPRAGFFLDDFPSSRNPSSRERNAKLAGRDARRPAGLPKMAALEEEFTLSAVPLGAGPGGLLGVEQSNKTDQFLITDSGRTVILYKVRTIGSARPRCHLSHC